MSFERYRCAECYYEGESPCPQHTSDGQNKSGQNQTSRALTNEEKRDADDFFMSQFSENARNHVEEARRLLSILLNDIYSPDAAHRIIGCAERQLEKAREILERQPPNPVTK